MDSANLSLLKQTIAGFTKSTCVAIKYYVCVYIVGNRETISARSQGGSGSPFLSSRGRLVCADGSLHPHLARRGIRRGNVTRRPTDVEGI